MTGFLWERNGLGFIQEPFCSSLCFLYCSMPFLNRLIPKRLCAGLHHLPNETDRHSGDDSRSRLSSELSQAQRLIRLTSDWPSQTDQHPSRLPLRTASLRFAAVPFGRLQNLIEPRVGR